jgi:hypothetical protein
MPKELRMSLPENTNAPILQETVNALIRETSRTTIDTFSEAMLDRKCGQPNWILIHNKYDEDDEGGDGEAILVIQDLTEAYDPMCLRFSRNMDGSVSLHSFNIETHFRCTHDPRHVGTNEFHPDNPEWYSSSSAGLEEYQVERLLSPNPVTRAYELLEIAMYHGIENFDNYPEEFTTKSPMKEVVSEYIKTRGFITNLTGYTYETETPVATCYGPASNLMSPSFVLSSKKRSILSTTGPVSYLISDHIASCLATHPKDEALSEVVETIRHLLIGVRKPDALAPIYPYCITISVVMRPLTFTKAGTRYEYGEAGGGMPRLAIAVGEHVDGTGWMDYGTMASGLSPAPFRDIETLMRTKNWDLQTQAEVYSLLIKSFLSTSDGIRNLPKFLKAVNFDVAPFDMSIANALFSWSSVKSKISSMHMRRTPATKSSDNAGDAAK